MADKIGYKITNQIFTNDTPITLTDNGDGTWSEKIAAALAASTSHVGQVGGEADVITTTPAITSGSAYASGQQVGNKMTLSTAVRLTGGVTVLQSLHITDISNQKAALDLLIFDSDPTNGTYSDKTTFTFNASDAVKFVTRVSIATSDYASVGGIASVTKALGLEIKANGSANLYVIAVTTSAPTYSTTNGLILKFGFLNN